MNNMFKQIARGFVSNLKTIIQALVFSIVIWLFISIQIFPDISLHISDISVKCDPTPFMEEENLRIVSVDTSAVAIQIEGKRYAINSLTSEDFVASCDLSEVYGSGKFQVPINVETKGQDVECKIKTTSLYAEIDVVKIISREIEVEPNTLTLTIEEEMQIEGEVSVNPSTVIITGEEKLVNSISRAEAIAVYDGVLGQSAEIPARISYYGASGAVIVNPDIREDNSDFTLNVPVYKVKTLPVRVKFTGSTISYSGFNADDLDYTMSIDEITIGSPDSSIDNLDAIDIGEISLSALTLKEIQGGVSLPVDLPEGYKNISGNKMITVNFPEADNFGQLGFTVPSDNITVMNKPSNYDIRVLTNELTVNVVGYSDYIQGITSSDIYVTVNLLGTELSEGVKSVSAMFRLTGGNVKAWVTGEEYKVDILITSAEEAEEQALSESGS